MAERGVFVDHAAVHRWSIKILPILAAVFRRNKRRVGPSWRMDETYAKMAGRWTYLYRAVDRDGDTVDFVLCAHRDRAAARRFFERAIDLHGVPKQITIDKSGANTAAIEGIRADSGADIELRRSRKPEQPGRAESSGDQSRRATHARIQELSLRTRLDRRPGTAKSLTRPASRV